MKAEPTLESYDYPVKGVKVYRLTYQSFGHSKIEGFYAVPDQTGPHPALVRFHGYNASYDDGIHDIVNWALHGYATFGMLVRGQGGSEDTSVTPWACIRMDDKRHFIEGYVLLSRRLSRCCSCT